MRIDFYVKWHTAMTCIAPEYVHKQLIIIHVVCCDAMTFLFIVRCYSTEYWNKKRQNEWNRVNQMYTQSSNKVKWMKQQQQQQQQQMPYPCQYIRSLKAIYNRLQSKIYIVYKLNKTKSSWKLKTYTCYCSSNNRKKSNTIHVCSEWPKFIRHRNESNLLPKNAHSCRSFIVQLSLEM